ncbi:hypothetical protein D6C83_06827 [Aureobasidium pullulans]|uniref:Uncharacterized protein n=1 Tax=Aureobasidium pullulans TaxID=5580 RepID=A0A4T0BIK5_AURPU|nr:hypothetical protein D6C83_06827 [Aureobasidium pullulans]
MLRLLLGVRHYDSDVSSVSSAEGVDDFDSPTWWDILDHEQEAIQRYKKFLRGQLHQGQGCEQRQKAEPEVAMTRIEASVSHEDDILAEAMQGEEQ